MLHKRQVRDPERALGRLKQDSKNKPCSERVGRWSWGNSTKKEQREKRRKTEELRKLED